MFMKNRFIDSADEDAVREYEKSLGISEIADTIEVRKSLIKTRLRGTQTSTRANLKAVIESYSILADISEDIPNYSFTVIFHQPNVPESVIKNIIEDLKPAHLSVTYSYEYTGTFEFAESENEYNIGVGLPMAMCMRIFGKYLMRECMNFNINCPSGRIAVQNRVTV